MINIVSGSTEALQFAENCQIDFSENQSEISSEQSQVSITTNNFEIKKTEKNQNIRKFLENQKDSILQNFQRINDEVIEIAKKGFVEPLPSIKFLNFPIFYEGTINTIQAQTGRHKSRFWEIIAAVYLSKYGKSNSNCGFEKAIDEDFDVTCIDTERNPKNELPNGINHIIRLSGDENLENFHCYSFRYIPKIYRLEMLKILLESNKTDKKRVVFIDVATDFILNFNDIYESNYFIEFLSGLADVYNATFFIAVHENPNVNPIYNSKMRGHFGTELLNKASTAFALSKYKKDKIKLQVLKIRSQMPIESQILKFNEEFKTLELVGDLEDVDSTEFTPLDGISEYLSTHFQSSSELKQSDAVEFITGTFSCSANTAKTRLIEIIRGKIVIPDNNGEECHLVQISSKGKPTVYQLKLAS